MKCKHDVDQNEGVLVFHNSWMRNKANVVDFQLELLVREILFAGEQTRQHFVRHSDGWRDLKALMGVLDESNRVRVVFLLLFVRFIRAEGQSVRISEKNRNLTLIFSKSIQTPYRNNKRSPFESDFTRITLRGFSILSFKQNYFLSHSRTKIVFDKSQKKLHKAETETRVDMAQFLSLLFF